MVVSLKINNMNYNKWVILFCESILLMSLSLLLPPKLILPGIFISFIVCIIIFIYPLIRKNNCQVASIGTGLHL